VLGIAAVIGVLWLIGQADKPTTSSAPTYSPPVQSAAPSYSPPAPPQEPSRPAESQPPVGQDTVLSTAQIRYCLAEDIRMDSAKSALNNYIDAMWIASTRWWPTTTAAAGVTAIDEGHWKAHGETLNPTVASYRLRAETDSLAVHPVAHCRRQHRRVPLRMRLSKPFSRGSMSLATTLELQTV